MIRRLFGCCRIPADGDTNAESSTPTACASTATQDRCDKSLPAEPAPKATSLPPIEPSPVDAGASTARTPPPLAISMVKVVASPTPALLDLTPLARLLMRQPGLKTRYDDGGWAYVPEEDTLFVPRALTRNHDTNGLQGALCREAGRWLYSRGPCHPQTLSPAFCVLWHSIDQIRTNLLICERHPPALPWLADYYRQTAEGRTVISGSAVSQAQSFVANLIGRAMYHTPLPADAAVEEALAVVLPDVQRLVAVPKGLDLVHGELPDTVATKLADETFEGVCEYVWPHYVSLLAQDVGTFANHGDVEAMQQAARTAPVPLRRVAWPFDRAHPDPLRSTADEPLEVCAAKGYLAAAVRALARAESSSLQLLQGGRGGLVTWEQAMTLKPRVKANHDDALDKELVRLDKRVCEGVRQTQKELDDLPYVRIRRKHASIIAELVLAIQRATTQAPERRKISRQRSGSYDLRRGMQAELRQHGGARPDPYVFRRSQLLQVNKTVEFLLCVDTSGSMQGANMEAARDAFVVFHEALDQCEIRAGALAYNSMPRILTPVGRSSEGQRFAALDSLRACGGNNEPKALNLARTMLQESTAEHRFILMLTDGGAEGDCERCVRTLEADTGIRVIGIGIGAGCGQVASIYPKSVVVPNVSELPRFIGNVLMEILTPAS